MSMQALADSAMAAIAARELTPLGKRIELLRIERGLSKQHLAREADTSRQQLWRVMTGKSELTGSLRVRLAGALRIDAAALTASSGALGGAFVFEAKAEPAQKTAPTTFEQYVSSVPALERTLAALPDDEPGWRLKRLFMNCLEDVATDAGLRLPPDYFALRARVTNRDDL